MRYLLLIILAAASLFACKTPQQASTQQYTKDSTIIREVPVTVKVPGATIQSPSINIDSLVQLIKDGVKPEYISQTLINEDPETKLKVGILIDELGNLSALCEQQDRMIEVLTKDVEHWRERYEKTTVTEHIPWWKRFINSLTEILIGVVISFIIIFALKLIRL
jgi:hypothetical protein